MQFCQKLWCMKFQDIYHRYVQYNVDNRYPIVWLVLMWLGLLHLSTKLWSIPVFCIECLGTWYQKLVHDISSGRHCDSLLVVFQEQKVLLSKPVTGIICNTNQINKNKENKAIYWQSFQVKSTLFITTLDTMTKFVIMIIWMSRNLCSRGDI